MGCNVCLENKINYSAIIFVLNTFPTGLIMVEYNF